MLPDARKTRLFFFLHSNLVERMPAVKGEMSLRGTRVSVFPHQKPCPMLNLGEIVLATNSKKLLNSPIPHVILTMPLGMYLPSGQGSGGQSTSRQRNSRSCKLEQGKANHARLL